jgi:glycine oxidase
MPATSDVVIVGGGVTGCAVAYYLGRAGVKATIIERDGIGRHASGYSAGGLNPLHGYPESLRPLGLESFTLHLGLWDELQRLTGRACQQRIISMVMVAFAEAELPGLQELLGIYEATAGFTARWLEPAELRELEPRIAPVALCGLYVYGNGVVDSYLYTGLLAEAAQHYGITVRVGNAQGIQSSHGRVTGVLLDNDIIACDQVVLAMGPWAGMAESWLRLSIPVEPLKGEILRMHLPGPVLAHDFMSADILLCSRPGNQVWCASTEERRGFDQEPSASAQQLLLQRAIRLMPVMAEATLVQHTACLRPVAPDWLPIVGRAPGWDNVYLATGGAKKGILLSSGIGRAVADLIIAGHTSLAIAPCAPERFGRPLECGVRSAE